MKRVLLYTLLIILYTWNISAQIVVKNYEISKSYPIQKPVLVDNKNMKGEDFTSSYLLNTTLNTEKLKGSLHLVQTDTEGLLPLAKPSQGFTLTAINFQLMADNFVEGTLEITAPTCLTVYETGKECKKKTTIEKSTTKAKVLSVPLTLEAAHRCTISLHVLCEAIDSVTPSIKCVFQPKNKKIRIRTAASMKDRYSLYNTVFGKRVKSVSVSPDGNYLLTTYLNKYEVKREQAYTTLTNLKNHKVIFTDPSNRKLHWLPKTSKLYYIVTGEKGTNVRILNPETLEDQLLISGLSFTQFNWSPDETFLIFSNEEKASKKEKELFRLASPEDRQPQSRTGRFISKYNLATGVTQRLTYGYHSTYMRDLRSDNKKMLFTCSRSVETNKRPFSETSLMEMDLQTLQVDTLFNGSFFNNAAYSPDGKQLILTGGPEFMNNLGKNCGNHPIPNNYDGQAYLMNIQTHEIQPISKDLNPSLRLLTWNRNDNCIYFKAEDKDLVNIYRYNPQKKEWFKLPIEVEVLSDFSIAQRNATAAYIGSGINYSTRAYTLDTQKGKSTLLADPMASTLDDILLGDVKEYNFNTTDGTTIYGHICYPPEFDAQKKYPMIVYYYGGTSPSTRFMDFYYGAELFASRGYVVYVINPSGATGFGQEFSARHVNAWGKQTADEIIEGTKRVCQDHPFINKDKIGCIGASYGGFMTMYLQTKTDLFACAVSHAGISNVTSYWGEGYWGVGYNYVAAADSYPWNNPDLFTQQGALFNADKIHTPLLMMHGTADTNVPIGESIQLYNALKLLNRTVELIEVDGENHHIMDYKKRDLWHKSIMSWFAKWLQDRPEWWNHLYPKVYIDGNN